MAAGQTLLLTLPTVGQAAWGGSLNGVLQSIIDAIGEAVPASSLDINGQLDMQGNIAVDLRGLTFTSSTGEGSRSIYWKSDGELYVTDGDGVEVQLTSGGAINVTSAGGFGGDYNGTTQGLAAYRQATGKFQFTTTSAGTTYALMESGQVLIHNGSSTGYQSLTVPAGSTTNVDWTFPGAYPESRRLIEVDRTGSMAHTVFPLLSGTVAAGGTYDVTGRLRVSGVSIFSGSIAHAIVFRTIDAVEGQLVTGAGGYVSSGSQGGFILQTAGSIVQIPLSIDVNKRVSSIEIELFTGTGTAQFTASLQSRRFASGIKLPLAVKGLNTTAGTYQPTFIINNTSLKSGAMPQLISSSGSYFVTIESQSTNAHVYGIYVAYDQPE